MHKSLELQSSVGVSMNWKLRHLVASYCLLSALLQPNYKRHFLLHYVSCFPVTLNIIGTHGFTIDWNIWVQNNWLLNWCSKSNSISPVFFMYLFWSVSPLDSWMIMYMNLSLSPCDFLEQKHSLEGWDLHSKLTDRAISGVSLFFWLGCPFLLCRLLEFVVWPLLTSHVVVIDVICYLAVLPFSYIFHGYGAFSHTHWCSDHLTCCVICVCGHRTTGIRLRILISDLLPSSSVSLSYPSILPRLILFGNWIWILSLLLWLWSDLLLEIYHLSISNLLSSAVIPVPFEDQSHISKYPWNLTWYSTGNWKSKQKLFCKLKL